MKRKIMKRKIYVLLLISFIAILFNSMFFIDSKIVKAGNDIIDSQIVSVIGRDSILTDEGIKVEPLGEDSEGNDAWKQEVLVPSINASDTIKELFSIKDGGSAGFEFSINMRDIKDNSKVINPSVNEGGTAFWVYVCNQKDDSKIAGLHIWTTDGVGCGVDIVDPISWKVIMPGSFWIAGNANLASSFSICFDKEHTFMAKCSAWDSIFWHTLDDQNHTSRDYFAKKLANVDAIYFRIQGSSGFKNKETIIVKNFYNNLNLREDDFAKSTVNTISLKPFEVIKPIGIEKNKECEFKTKSLYTDFVYQIEDEGIINDGLKYIPLDSGLKEIKIIGINSRNEKFIKVVSINAIEDFLNEEIYEYFDGWDQNPFYSNKGIELEVPGYDLVGSNAWMYSANIPGNNENELLKEQFSLENNNQIVLEFEIDFYDEDNKILSQSNNGPAFYIIAYDVKTNKQLSALKIWSDSGSYDNGSHSYVLYGKENEYEDYSNGSWINGDARVNKTFTVAFDKENYFSAYVNNNDYLTPLANSSFYNYMKGYIDDVSQVMFKINGDNGFTTNTKVILHSINGHQLNKNVVYHNVSIDGKIQKVEDGKYASLEEDYKLHYTFDGYVDKNGNKIDLSQPILEDLEVFSNWKLNEYKVGFDDKEYTYKYGDKLKDIPIPVKNGYAFIGYYDRNDNKLDENLTVTKNMNFYSVFKKNNKGCKSSVNPSLTLILLFTLIIGRRNKYEK